MQIVNWDDSAEDRAYWDYCQHEELNSVIIVIIGDPFVNETLNIRFP